MVLVIKIPLQQLDFITPKLRGVLGNKMFNILGCNYLELKTFTYSNQFSGLTNCRGSVSELHIER